MKKTVLFVLVALLVGLTSSVSAAEGKIAVVKSEYTRDFYMTSGANYLAYWGTVENMLWNLGIDNWVKLTDEDVENGALDAAEYDLAILAIQNNLSEAEAQAIRQFVEQGGALLTGYNVGLRDETGRTLANFQLADVLGLDLAGLPTQAEQEAGKYGLMMVNDPDHPLFAGLPESIPFPKHYAVLATPRKGTRVLATWANDDGKPSRPPSTNGAVFLNGKVLYTGGLLFDPDMGVSETPEIQQLVKNAIDYLLGLSN